MTRFASHCGEILRRQEDTRAYTNEKRTVFVAQSRLKFSQDIKLAGWMGNEERLMRCIVGKSKIIYRERDSGTG